MSNLFISISLGIRIDLSFLMTSYKAEVAPLLGQMLRHPVRLPLNLLFLKSARCLKNQLQKFVCPVIRSTCHLYLLSDKLTENAVHIYHCLAYC